MKNILLISAFLIAFASNAQVVRLIEGDTISISGEGSISAENQNRIDNENKIKSFVKTANFLYTPLDIETTTGTSDNGKKSIVENSTGTSLEGEMEDADIGEGETVLIRAIGTGSEVVSYVVDGDNTQFRSLDGTLGNQHVTSENSECAGTKEGNIITIGCGTVSTRVFTNNIIQNSTFDDASWWSLQNGSTISAGEALLVGAGDPSVNSNHSMFVIALTIGESYSGTFEILRTAGTGNAYIGDGNTTVFTASSINGVNQTITIPSFTATTTRFSISLDSGTNGTVDNVILNLE